MYKKRKKKHVATFIVYIQEFVSFGAASVTCLGISAGTAVVSKIKKKKIGSNPMLFFLYAVFFFIFVRQCQPLCVANFGGSNSRNPRENVTKDMIGIKVGAIGLGIIAGYAACYKRPPNKALVVFGLRSSNKVMSADKTSTLNRIPLSSKQLHGRIRKCLSLFG